MRLSKALISATSTIKPPTDAAKGAFYDTANRTYGAVKKVLCLAQGPVAICLVHDTIPQVMQG